MASIYRRGKKWWIKYYKNGEMVRHSLNTENPKIAKYQQNEIENKLVIGDSPIIDKNNNTKEVLDKFYEYCKIHINNKTLQSYKNFLDNFFKWNGYCNLINITEPLVVDYIKKKSNWGPYSKNGFVKVLKTFINFAIRNKYMPNTPLNIKTPKIDKLPPPYLEKKEIKKLIKTSKSENRLYPRIIMGLYTGARPSEILRLKWKDLDFKNNVITIQKSKIGKFRRIVMHPELKKELKKLPPNSDKVFCRDNIINERRIIRRIKKNAEITHVKNFLYCLRHTFATHYYLETKDLKELSRILGHSNIQTTTIYVHPLEEHSHAQIKKLKY